MPTRYWVYTLLAVLSALCAGYGIFWLDQATSQHVAPPPVTATPEIVSSYPPLGSDRKDVDALLAIDFSGSMRDSSDLPGADPDDLRINAAELMVDSLAADVFPRATRMGYIIFGQGAFIRKDLSSIEAPEARQALNILLRSRESYYDQTDIGGALRMSYDMFFPSGTSTSSNTPALILLTDGQPVGQGMYGNNNEQDIREEVRRLTSKGVILFVIILRNPNASETAGLTYWRKTWYEIAQENRNVRYIEAQKAEELAGIYNKIRARLVNEGVRPGELHSYDATDPKSGLRLPPNLLQAQLLVSKPLGIEDLDLISPGSTNFQTRQQQDSKNQLLESGLYNRYTIYRPETGDWNLAIDPTQPVSYVLNMESVYSAHIVWPGGTPFVDLDNPTQLSWVIIGEDGIPVSKEFKLQAAIVRTVQEEDGTYVESETPLPTPQRKLGDAYPVYVTQVVPDMLEPDGSMMVQIYGQADDGSLINIALNRLPSARKPGPIKVALPTSVECSASEFKFFPPAIVCNNVVTMTVTVSAGDRLHESTLEGLLLPPGTGQPLPLQVIPPGTKGAILQITTAPLTEAGSYTYTIQVSGRFGESNLDLAWQDSTQGTVELIWPTWVPRLRAQLELGLILLIILGLWKPLLVPILLPIFRLLRLAPSGYSSIDGKFAENIYEIARKRHKLFSISVGRWDSRSLDHRIEEDCLDMDPSRGRFGKISDAFKRWLCRRPLARLVAMPFNKIYSEGENGFEMCGELRPSPLRIGRSRILVAQSDWTQT